MKAFNVLCNWVIVRERLRGRENVMHRDQPQESKRSQIPKKAQHYGFQPSSKSGIMKQTSRRMIWSGNAMKE
jgi:hypothetical protein